MQNLYSDYEIRSWPELVRCSKGLKTDEERFKLKLPTVEEVILTYINTGKVILDIKNKNNKNTIIYI